MSILSKITAGRSARAQKVCIYAPEGFGKSTLGAQFPEPLFLDVEDSTSQLNVNRLTRSVLPDLKTFEAALNEIAASKPCATLVIDTADWLEQMAVDDVIAAANNKKITGIEDFGYGKGYTILRERITILLAGLDRVIAAGVHVVLLAHANVKKFEPPDGAGPYDRYELKLSKQVAPLIKEWADMVLFGNWRTQVVERDKHETGAKFKGVGGKERQMYCNRCSAWDAKNRHGMADVEKWEIGVIERAFRNVGAPWGGTEVPAKLVTQNNLRAGTADPATTGAGGATSDSASVQPTAACSAPSLNKDKAPVTPPALNPDFAKICEPHTEAVNAYLIEHREIQPGQDWTKAPERFIARALKNPVAFLKAAQSLNGKAVTA